MSKKYTILGVFLIIIICLSASCSSNSPASLSTPLKVEWTDWPGDYTILVADQMGLFKKNGVNVDLIHYDLSTKALPDLAGGKLDGGILTMSDLLLAANLTDIKAVMVSDNGGQYSLVASPDIKTVTDLQGKRIGLNLHTSGEMFVTEMLKTKYLTANEVTFVELSPDQVSASIPNQIDAGLVWEPYTSQAIKQGKVVVFQSDFISSLLPRLIVFRSSVIEQHPQDIHAFLRAWDEAVQYRNTHPQESLSLIANATSKNASQLNITGKITLFSIADNVGLFSNPAGSDPSSIYFLAGTNRDFLVSAGYLTSPPSINSLLDPTFLK